MVDENFDLHVPSTTRRVDGVAVLVDIRGYRGSRKCSEETRVKLGASGGDGRQEPTSSFNRTKGVEGRHRWSGGSYSQLQR